MKYFILFVLSSLSISLLAQEVPIPRNEIKLNAYYLIAGGFEISYERTINDESSFGMSATYVFEDFDFKWGMLPYYRMYFGKKPNRGFFAEGNMFLGMHQDVVYTFDIDNFSSSVITQDLRFGGGLGLAIGGKFTTKRNVIFEIYSGVGRVFENNASYTKYYPRGGITIGKRF